VFVLVNMLLCSIVFRDVLRLRVVVQNVLPCSLVFFGGFRLCFHTRTFRLSLYIASDEVRDAPHFVLSLLLYTLYS
jgi:hypothetical protein